MSALTSAEGGRRAATALVAAARNRPLLVSIPLLVPLLALVGRAATWGWRPTGDFSHTEFLLRAIPDHPPLVGVAARVGEFGPQGFTPGPSMAYLLWPLYRVLGASPWAMVTSVVVLHGVAIVAAVALAARLGGTAAALLAAGVLAVLVRSLGPGFFGQPWNVWVPVLAFFAFLLLVWGVTMGETRWLPWAAAVGTHCLQTHISYLGLVTGLLAGALAWTLWRWRRDGVDPHGWRHLGQAAAVTAVMWVPPVIEQFQPGTGNLRKLVTEFRSPPEPAVGWGTGLKALAGEFNLLGPWIVGPGKRPEESPNLVGFVAFWVLVAVGVMLAVRRRDRVVLHLHAVLGAAVLLGAISAARVFGTFFDYVIRWAWPLAAALAMVSLWSIHRTLAGGAAARRHPAWRDGAMGVAAVAAIALLVAAVGADATAGAPYARDSRTVAGITRAVEPVLHGDLDYVLEHHDPASLSGVAYGAVLELRRDGFDVGAGGWGRAGVRKENARDVSDSDAVLWLVGGEGPIEAYRARADAIPLASFDPRTDVERARSSALRATLVERLCVLGGDELAARLDSHYGEQYLLFNDLLPPADESLLQDYNDLRRPVAVFELLPDAPAVDLSLEALAGQHPCR